MEQSSTSKIKLPNKELVGVKKDESKQILKKTTTTNWLRLLVLPFKNERENKRRISSCRVNFRETTSRITVWFSFTNGSRLFITRTRIDIDGPWCKEGQWVMFARYAGSRIKIEGGEIRLLNDDEVLATIKNPEDILHEF